MAEETITREKVSTTDIRKELSSIVGGYVDLGEVSIGDDKKVRLSIASVTDIDGEAIRVLRMVEGTSGEDLSQYQGTGNEIEMSETEKKALKKCLSRKMPLMAAAYIAFNEPENVDSYLDGFPQYPLTNDEGENAITLGITGPSSMGKTTLLSDVAKWMPEDAIFERMDVFSRTTIADYLEIGARGDNNGNTVAEIARKESNTSQYKKIRNASKLTMKVKLLSFAGNLAFNKDNFHSVVFFDNPSTFNFSDNNRKPDVFDLVVLEGMDGTLPISEARAVLSDEAKTRNWISTVRNKSNAVRDHLLDTLSE